MNPIVRHFVPSVVRGVYRTDDELSKIEDSQTFERFIKAKLKFIPLNLRDIVEGLASEDKNFETAKLQRALPDNFIDSTGIKQRIRSFFQRHTYFDNALGTQDEVRESDNYLEIQFVQKVLARLLNDAGLLLIQPQRRVGHYQVDFALEGASKFAIEVDGFGKFKDRRDLDGFIQRQNYIASQGWRVIRFTYSQIINDTEATLKLLYTLLSDDSQLRHFLTIRRGARDQQQSLSLFQNITNNITDVVNAFYCVQDVFVEKVLLLGQSTRPIRLKDDFGFTVPFVAISIIALYNFLAAVQSVIDVDFQLPSVEVTGCGNSQEWNKKLHDLVAIYDECGEWNKKLHDLFAIYDECGDSDLIFDAQTVQLKPASLPAPTLGEETVRFRKKLKLEEIHQGFNYFTSEIFGYSSGTNNFQNCILQRVFDGEHVLGISTTGSGKSFCFWLPALLKPGLTLVICPLRSLMRDQRLTLRNYGIASVEFINSDVDKSKQRRIFEEVKFGYIRLLYISPERLRIKKFLEDLAELNQSVPINFIAIDEAHCISEWGHDFRPSYLKLPLLREMLSKNNQQLQLIALTATAGQQVEKDMLGILKLRDGHVMREPSADREKFSYQIVAVQEGATKAQTYRQILTKDLPKALREPSIKKLLKKNNERGEKSLGIVFCIYADPHGQHSIRDGTAHYLYETMTILEPEARRIWSLEAYGTGKVRTFASKPPSLCPRCYSYAFTSKSSWNRNEDDDGLEDDDDEEEKSSGQNAGIKSCSDCGHEFKASDIKQPPAWETLIKANQDDFKDDRFDILVATKGFGMGIDKSSVRFIIHTSLSSGLESWYQEIGRAGRDSERAHIVLLVDPPNELCLRELHRLPIKRPSCKSYQGGCPHGKKALCDYGKQHMFVIRSYPGAESDAISALRVLDKVIAACEDSPNGSIKLNTSRTYLTYMELAIYRLTVLGLVNNYVLTYQKKPHFDVDFLLPNFSSEANILTKLQKTIKGQLIEYLSHFNNGKEQKNFEHVLELKTKDYQPLEKFTAKTREFETFDRYQEIFQLVYKYLLLLLDHTYKDVVKMRYDMLWNLFAVVQSSKNDQCRRIKILPHFEGQDLDDQYRCNCCDVCSPSLNFSESVNPRQQNRSVDSYARELAEAFRTDVFDLKKLQMLVAVFSDYKVSTYTKARAILEGNANNLTALFIAREFSPSEEYLANTKRLLQTANQRPLPLSQVKELYELSRKPHSELLFTLNEAGTACDSSEGRSFLLEQARKPENRQNSKVLAIAECLDFMVFVGQKDLSYTTESLKRKAHALENAFYA